MRSAILLLSCFGGMLPLRTAQSQATIDLKLNVFYSNPADAASGGAWEVVAKSSHSGISGVSALLTNISTASNRAPIGTVNGSDEAGFGLFHNTFNPLGFRNITVGQVPLPPGNIGLGEEQTVFYGVGTLTNGAPNYPGRPAGTTFIGPAFNTLMVPPVISGIPWATGDAFGDPLWNTAARLATGTFPAGITPGFFHDDDYASSGNVFTTLGSSMTPGTISLATVSTIVRTNLNAGAMLPDYNDNGFVDAADYVVWRNTRDQTGAGLAADGNNDGIVNQADYDLWRTHFGKPAPGTGTALASSMSIAPVTVPEPASGILLLIGVASVCGRHRRRY
jgi:hypothetical protein